MVFVSGIMLLKVVFISLCLTMTICCPDCPLKVARHEVVFKKHIPFRTFRTFIDVSFDRCVLECGLRHKCKSVNYHEKMNFCQLNNETFPGRDLMNKQGYSFYHMTDSFRRRSLEHCGQPLCPIGQACRQGVCVFEECPVPELKNHQRILGNMYAVGKKLLLKCEPGYHLSPTPGVAQTKAGVTMVCQSDGEWSDIDRVCELDPTTIDCGSAPDAPSNGTLVSSVGAPFLAIVTYGCNIGYLLTGSATINCLPNELWEPVPSCNITDCGPAPPAPDDGVMSANTGTTYLSTTTYTCNAGHVINGNDVITCQGLWGWEDPPTCDILDCGPAPPVPNNGVMSGNTGTTYLSTATYTCNPGHVMTGDDVITCQGDSTWEIPPTCDILDCGPVPLPPADGVMTANTGTTYLSTATYTCNPGHVMNGNDVITCDENGNWEIPPTCDILDCGPVPPPPADGVMTGNTGTTYLSTATYTCNPGHVRNGDDVITCDEDGDWGIPPTCDQQDKDSIDCGPAPSAPDNGEMTGNTGTTYQSTATYTCNPGHVMTGDDVITCLGDSTWEVPPTCDILDCGPVPPPPADGVMTGNTGTTYLSTATYTCNPGHVRNGDDVITCQGDSTWEIPPTCDILDCGPVPDAPYAGEVFSNTGTAYLATTTYSCLPGYDITGSDTITCQADGNWESPPTCDLIDSSGGGSGDNDTIIVSNSLEPEVMPI